jgi:hypothetical protein
VSEKGDTLLSRVSTRILSDAVIISEEPRGAVQLTDAYDSVTISEQYVCQNGTDLLSGRQAESGHIAVSCRCVAVWSGRAVVQAGMPSRDLDLQRSHSQACPQ